jgi:hypothetical protein
VESRRTRRCCCYRHRSDSCLETDVNRTGWLEPGALHGHHRSRHQSDWMDLRLRRCHDVRSERT